MKKTMAIIHTGLVLVPMLTDLAKKIMPEIRIRNIVDDSLLPDCMEAGKLTDEVARRIVSYMLNAEQFGADCILSSCSSVGLAVDMAKPLLKIPVIKIDEPMAEEAIKRGSCIALVATVPTTIAPSAGLIREKAKMLGKSVNIKEFLCEEAFKTLIKGDVKGHNRILKNIIEKAAAEYDAVVLAQGSMYNIVPELSAEIRDKTLSSPLLGIQRAREIILGF